MTLRPKSLEEVQEAVRAYPRLRARGGGSKPALSRPQEGEVLLELSGLRGLLAYEPEEFVFTALAGTPLQEVEATLRAHGQYLPFDPPLLEGATLGGTVAAGLSGPMRHRYGGVRDFLLGVRFVDGEGKVVRGGGQVVKNAAGFPFHRLMVGSLGAFGVMVELSFKVFPWPEATATLLLEYGSLGEALEALGRLRQAPLDLLALDLVPPSRLEVRLGGLGKSLPKRLEKVQGFLGRGGEVLWADEAHWQGVRALRFLEGSPLWAKVPLKPRLIPKLEALGLKARRYLAGGEVAYLGLGVEDLPRLEALGLPYLLLRGEGEPLFPRPQDPFFLGLKKALDPKGRFPLRWNHAA